MTYSRRSSLKAIQSYATVGLETEVMSARPERLITLLLAGARAAIAKARIHLDNNRIAERGAAISKAIRIVDEGLRAALDLKTGGELAANLERLYEYVIRTLLAANLRADRAQLDHADALLANIEEGWRTSVDKTAALG
ncbi:MAG: flagellar export chaperone FliS [Burkholderiaceae bacterium]|nr:flagellar export chaperone FliS [Burkholderiaceae bacterium]